MRCGACGASFAPPQPVCTRCGRDDSLERLALAGEGKLYSYTVVRVAPEGLEAEAPYAIGIVELEGGARVTGRIEGRDFDSLAIDRPVRLSRIERGVSFWGPA
jgi:uncharacterized OB-fold protein